MAGCSIGFHHGEAVILSGFSPPILAPFLVATPPPALDQGELLLTLIAAVGSFVATNIDDILLLVLFFSQVTNRRAALAVVGGQVLGIGLLLLVSMAGLVGQAFLPRPWLGLLGLLPISIAVSHWLDGQERPTDPAPGANAPLATGGPAPGALAVAALTLANGGDNIGVYLPMFAHAGPGQTVVTLLVFAAMVGLWCLLAWRLAHAPGLGGLLRLHGPRLMPPLLIGLGLSLLWQAHTFTHRGLALLTLLALAAMALPLARRPWPSPALVPPTPVPLRLPSP